MRPISLTAVVLIRILDGAVYALWFGVWLYGGKFLADLAGGFLFPYAWVPGGIVVAIVVAHMLRPVRKTFALGFAREMARSRSRSLMEVGVYCLLRVAYRFWPQDPVTDFVGLATLHRLYDQSRPAHREQLYAVVRQMESAPGCAQAQPAHEFLDEIGKEVDSAAPAPPVLR
jgi:hypothetical protein